jgi:ABC-type proline/glycine betaine transport system ATPase subunit
MTTAPLGRWERYLTAEDYRYLMQFVQNVKLGFTNDKMLILYGTGRNGKTTLIKEICEYLGEENCGDLPENILGYEKIPKLGIYRDFTGMDVSKQNINIIVNLIKYKQSLIGETFDLEGIHPRIFELSRVINMEHVF